MARISSTILVWKAGFSSERVGSPVIRIEPEIRRMTRVGQIQVRKREV